MQNQTDSPAPNFPLEKRQTLWILLAIFFAAGWFGAIITEDSGYYPLYQLGFGLFSTIFIVRWVALDALERGFQLTTLWLVFFVLFAIITVPFYLFKTRGLNAWRPLLGALGLLFAFGLAAALGQSIATAIGLS